MAETLITYILPNGEEHEEHWPSVAAFRAWAETRDQRLRYRAYVEDEDGEWTLTESGRVSGGTHGSDA